MDWRLEAEWGSHYSFERCYENNTGTWVRARPPESPRLKNEVKTEPETYAVVDYASVVVVWTITTR